MSLEQWFWIAHVPALVGWISLLAAPLTGPVAVRFARVVAGLLALGYLALFLSAPHGLMDLAVNYSLAGVDALFADRRLLLLGWVHYLAFDLWVGSWETEEARRRGIPHWQLVPCLFLTCMLGPLGLLLFLVTRAGRGRRR